MCPKLYGSSVISVILNVVKGKEYFFCNLLNLKSAEVAGPSIGISNCGCFTSNFAKELLYQYIVVSIPFLIKDDGFVTKFTKNHEC